MRKLYLELGVYAFLMVCGAIVISEVSQLPEPMPGDLGSDFFPKALAIIMMGFCVIGALSALLSRDNEKIVVGGSKKILVTIGALAAFFGLWSFVGYFFVFAFLFLFGMLTFFATDEKLTTRIVLYNFIGTAFFIGLSYLFFTEVLYTRF